MSSLHCQEFLLVPGMSKVNINDKFVLYHMYCLKVSLHIHAGQTFQMQTFNQGLYIKLIQLNHKADYYEYLVYSWY